MEINESKYQNGNLNEKYDTIRDEKGNSIKDGKYEKWYESGKKECEGEYIENLKFGHWKYWYENGDLKEEGEYFNDTKSDNWKTYSPTNTEFNYKTENLEKSQIKNSNGTTNTLKISSIMNGPDLQDTAFTDEIKKIPNNNTNSQKFPTTKEYKSLYAILGAGFVIILILLYVLVFKNSSREDLNNSKVTSLTQIDSVKRVDRLNDKIPTLKEKEQSQQKEFQANIHSPDGVVIKFIQALGQRDWSSAYGLMSEKRRGNFENFKSTKGYGGITSTKIYNCSYTGKVNGSFVVAVYYESIDPANKNGRFQQEFYLTPSRDSYIITEIKNINLEWF